MPTDEPKPATSADPARESEPTETKQSVLKKAEDSGDDATGGTGLLTGIAQA